MSERDWTKCSTLVSHSRFNDQHKQGETYVVIEERIFIPIMRRFI